MRQAREQELKYLRDLGVCEKVDEREANVQDQVTPESTRPQLQRNVPSKNVVKA